MTGNDSIRATALDWIAANEARMSAFCAGIWAHAEPAWREYKSARDYVDLLRAEGLPTLPKAIDELVRGRSG